jgi:glycogen synthase
VSVTGVEASTGSLFRDSQRAILLDTLYRNVVMSGFEEDVDIIHCHTWYPALAGCLLQQLLQRPLVLTTHSLEPHRPWKAEQLGSGYRVSRWLERVAYSGAQGVIAVSDYMKGELESLYGVPPRNIRVIPNGIDTSRFKPTFDVEVLRAYGIDPNKPFVLFVGRITRQKGIDHLLEAISWLPSDIQIVLCASSPDTASLAKEVESKVDEVRSTSLAKTVWIAQSLPIDDLVVLYSHASVFVCPSIYEPFGIINLEAMACGTPVVASAVGGIPEVVVDQHTGLLVPLSVDSSGAVRDPKTFSRALAGSVSDLLASPERLRSMGVESRRRVERFFSWERVAAQTLNYYTELVQQKPE